LKDEISYRENMLNKRVTEDISGKSVGFGDGRAGFES
jgi:hypothetical protein